MAASKGSLIMVFFLQNMGKDYKIKNKVRLFDSLTGKTVGRLLIPRGEKCVIYENMINMREKDLVTLAFYCFEDTSGTLHLTIYTSCKTIIGDKQVYTLSRNKTITHVVGKLCRQFNFELILEVDGSYILHQHSNHIRFVILRNIYGASWKQSHRLSIPEQLTELTGKEELGIFIMRGKIPRPYLRAFQIECFARNALNPKIKRAAVRQIPVLIAGSYHNNQFDKSKTRVDQQGSILQVRRKKGNTHRYDVMDVLTVDP
jgi:hypothetical protein